MLRPGVVDSADALLWAACLGGHLDTAALLMEAGADSNGTAGTP